MIGSTSRLLRWLNLAPVDDGTWLDTLALYHPTWPAPFFIAAAPAALRLTLETGVTQEFIPYAFSVTLPGSGLNGKQELNATLANVGGPIWDALEQAQTQPQKPITAEWRVYLSSDFTRPQATPYRMTVTGVAATLEAITLTAARADLINRRFPSVVYRPESWPGLVR